LGKSLKDSVDANIKDAAIRTAAEHGFEGLNVRAICDLADISDEEFHTRWPDAWAALLDAFDERTRLPTLPDTGNLSDDLVIYVLDHVMLAGDDTFRMLMFRLLAEMRSDAGLRTRFEPGFVDRRTRNLVVVHRAIARGELPADVDGDEVLDAVLGLGLSLLSKGLPPQEPEVRRAVDQVIAHARNL
jgi:AcrR family transcriptional regulator